MALISKKKIFYVNSRNRIDGTDSDFSYVFDLTNDDDFDHIAVLQVLLPKSYYLIQAGQNTFTLQEGVSSVTISITPGNYTRRNFAYALEQLLSSSSPNGFVYVILYSTTVDDGKYIFSVTNNGTTQPAFIFTDYVYEAMGFNANTTNTFSTNQLKSTNVIKLQPEDSIYIHSDLANNGHDDILQELFVSTGESFYSNIHWENLDIESYSKQLVSNKKKVGRFMLTNEDGQPIDLNGQNWQMTVMFYKHNNIYNTIKGFLKLQLLNQ